MHRICFPIIIGKPFKSYHFNMIRDSIHLNSGNRVQVKMVLLLIVGNKMANSYLKGSV